MGKSVAILLSLVLAMSVFIFLAFESTSGLPKPSVPEFTVKFVDNSYDVPPKYAINSYTGKTEMIEAGYHIQNQSIEFTIKNQAFTSYHNENNSVVGLYYSLHIKGHFQEGFGEPTINKYIYRSDGDYTVIDCGLPGYNGSIPYSGDVWLGGYGNMSGGQVDVQVKALIGYYTIIHGTPSPADVFNHGVPSESEVFTGEASEWSSTQTITIDDSASTTTSNPSPSSSSPTSTASASPTQNPNATPEPSVVETGVLFGLGWEEIALIILSVAVVGLIALVVFQRRSNKKPLLASG
jgi:hypothetical protein